MIKILYVVSTLSDTGPTNQLFGIVRNLDKELFAAYVLTLSPEPKDSKKQQFIEEKIKVLSLEMGRKEFFIRGNSRLKEVILDISPDILHTSGIRADVAVSELKLNIPNCNSIRNYVYEDYIPLYGSAKGYLMARIHKRAIGKIDYPVCCSETLRGMYQALLKKDVYAIQNGVDTQKYGVCSDREREILRKNIGVEKDKYVFVMVGGLMERKDPLTVIRAFGKLKQKEQSILLVLGKGELQEQCEQKAGTNILFLGHVTNVKDYLQLADGFISASMSEGLPNAVLEGGACGLSMILSDIPQHREIFHEETSEIKYFPIQDVEQLTNRINELVMGRNFVDREKISTYIKENFDNRVTSKKFQALYSKMANKGA